MNEYWNDDSEKFFEEYAKKSFENPFVNCRCHIITNFDKKSLYELLKNESKEIANNYLWDENNYINN